MITKLQVVGSVETPYKLFLPQSMIPGENEWDGALCYRLGKDYLGVAEFTAPDSCIVIPESLLSKQNIRIGDFVSVAQAQLPRGSQVTLKATDSLDWKHVLEQYLPQHYTTLQKGQEIVVEYNGTHKITVERCEPGDAICIIDTDLDLDLDAPFEEPTASVGYGTWPLAQTPTLVPAGTLTVEGVAFVGPEYATCPDSYLYRVVDRVDLETPMAVCGEGTFTIAQPVTTVSGPSPSSSDPVCSTCGKHVPAQSLVLHQAFCARNTVKCTCGQTFSQKIPENHWHCDQCEHTETSDFKASHQRQHEYVVCECGYKSLFGDVAQHRATNCPHRLHICQFCHLLVPQGEETPINRIQGYSEHEASCGTKTTNCPQCRKVVMVRNLASHLLHHEQLRLDRSAQSPTLCANVNCPNMVAAPGQDQTPKSHLGLCRSCYGIVYVSQHDPDLSKIKGRIERRYMIQLTRGCGNSWCANTKCASGTGIKVSFKDAAEEAKALMALDQVFLCVDRNASRKALFLDDEPEFSREWKGMAISVCSSEADARVWLANNAPRVDGT